MFWSHKDLNVYYETFGEGQPVFLIHGYTVDSRLMKGCFEPIFQGKAYKRIYIDLPGMGQTKAAGWIENADVMLEILESFLNEMIPDGKFLIAGESYGGYLMRGIIRNMPERIAGSLFLCPCVIPDLDARTVPDHEVLVMMDAETYSDSEDYADFNDITVIQTPATWQRYQSEILPGLKCADDDFLMAYRARGYGFSFDVDAGEEKYHFPAMFLLGRQDDSVGYKDAWNLLDHYSRASFMVVDGAGHNLQIEQEEIFAACVRQWLRSVAPNS